MPSAWVRVRFETGETGFGGISPGRTKGLKTAPPMEAKTTHQPLGHGFRNGLLGQQDGGEVSSSDVVGPHQRYIGGTMGSVANHVEYVVE